MQDDRMTASNKQIDPSAIVFAPKTENSYFWNARQKLNPKDLVELKEFIQHDGLLEEIVVRQIGEQYQVVCGERRLRCIQKLIEDNVICHDLRTGRTKAAKDLFKTLNCKVLFNCSDKHACRLSVTENLKRKDLTEWELMEYCRQLGECRDHKNNPVYSRKDICDIIARSATWVSQTMSLYELPSKIQEMLGEGQLPRTVALGLLKVEKTKVMDVVTLAYDMACADLDQERDQIASEIQSLENDLAATHIAVASATITGDTHSKKESSALRTVIDRKLQDAQSRQSTANNRQPRLNADVISKATDQVDNARTGKSVGMSQKAIRLEIEKIASILSKDDEICNESGDLFDRRDIALVNIGLQMAIGRADRSTLVALTQFYINEGRWEEVKLESAEAA